MGIEKRLMDKDFEGVSNRAYILGDIVRVEGRGVHRGIRQLLVLVKSCKKIGKKSYSLVVLPDCKETESKVKRNARIYAEGILEVSYTFNNDEVKHVFVQPEVVKEIEGDVGVEQDIDFYMNYTMYNRVVLNAVINTQPHKRRVKSSRAGLNKFKIKFKGGGGRYRTINCILWDTVNDLPELDVGMRVKVIGSLLVLNSDIVDSNRTDDYSGKNKRTTYTLIIQKVFDLDMKPEKLAKKLYK